MLQISLNHHALTAILTKAAQYEHIGTDASMSLGMNVFGKCKFLFMESGVSPSIAAEISKQKLRLGMD